MKRTLATILTVFVLVASAYAQGTVNFANSAASLVKVRTSWTDATFINMPVGGGRVELLWAPIGTSDLNLFSSVATTDFHTVPGRFSGGVVTIPWVAGDPVALLVRGWTGSSLTWDGVNDWWGADFIGYSSIFTLPATGNPNTVPPGIPVSINPAFPGLWIGVLIPEPSSMALAGLGTVSLLLYRRRVPARLP